MTCLWKRYSTDTLSDRLKVLSWIPSFLLWREAFHLHLMTSGVVPEWVESLLNLLVESDSLSLGPPVGENINQETENCSKKL